MIARMSPIVRFWVSLICSAFMLNIPAINERGSRTKSQKSGVINRSKYLVAHTNIMVTMVNRSIVVDCCTDSLASSRAEYASETLACFCFRSNKSQIFGLSIGAFGFHILRLTSL